MTLPDAVIELPDGRLMTEEGEAVFAYSGYAGCPWLTETCGRRRTPPTRGRTYEGTATN
jgi:hypothetical protein